MVKQAVERENEQDEERHATNLELFLDLVFVFSVTQITGMFSHDLSWAGVGRAAIVSWLVWWQWSQFTWAGAAVDLQRNPGTRLLVLVTIPPTLVMATAIPDAYGDSAWWFGAAYLVVQLLVLGMQGSESLKAEATRRAFVQYASVAAISPVVVFVGCFLEGDARVAAWVIASAVNVIGALRGAGAGEWVINPVHFAERHALFVIIALGEVLVAVGATASGEGLSARILLGLGIAAGGACVIWWMYFAYIPNVVEHALRKASGSARGVLARDLFTFGHFPIVAGIICYAVVVKHLVPAATAVAHLSEHWLLVATVVLIVGGILHMQFRIARSLAAERLAAIAIVAVWCALTSELPAAVVVGGVLGVLAIMQAISWRRYRRSSAR